MQTAIKVMHAEGLPAYVEIGFFAEAATIELKSLNISETLFHLPTTKTKFNFMKAQINRQLDKIFEKVDIERQNLLNEQALLKKKQEQIAKRLNYLKDF